MQAAVLLVRSLKGISKQDMLEVGGLADLRGYLIGQETVGVPQHNSWCPLIVVIGTKRHLNRRVDWSHIPEVILVSVSLVCVHPKSARL